MKISIKRNHQEFQQSNNSQEREFNLKIQPINGRAKPKKKTANTHNGAVSFQIMISLSRSALTPLYITLADDLKNLPPPSKRSLELLFIRA